MELEPVLSNDSADFCSIQDKQYGAKDRSLLDPSGHVEQLVDKAGYPSAFYCSLSRAYTLSYRIVSYRIASYSRCIAITSERSPSTESDLLIFAARSYASWVVHGEIGCGKWKKTLAYLLVLPGSRARIVRCGGRYDHQLVKRSSE